MKISRYIKLFEKKFNCTLVEYKGCNYEIIFKNNDLNKIFTVSYRTLFDRVDNNNDIYKADFAGIIYMKLADICKENNVILVSDYKDAKTNLIFYHLVSGVYHKQTWDTIKSQKFTLKYNKEYYTFNIKQKLFNLDMTCLSEGLFYDKLAISFKCNKCDFVFNESCGKILYRRKHCTNCDSKVKFNKLINIKQVLKNPYKEYFIYFSKFTTLADENVFKIGLTRLNKVESRFRYVDYVNPEILFELKLPFYQAFYIEQFIIKEFKNFIYSRKLKFPGYMETFNSQINTNEVIQKIMTLFEEIQNRKPCELLESLKEDNQQPSLENAN